MSLMTINEVTVPVKHQNWPVNDSEQVTFLSLQTKCNNQLVYYYKLNLFAVQKDAPSDQQLHLAALQGNVEQIRKVFESGKVHVDCKDKVSSSCQLSQQDIAIEI